MGWRVRFFGAILILGLCLSDGGAQDGNLVVGYATVAGEGGAAAPVASALFSLRSGGVLISEAAVAAVPPIRRGRIFVDREGSRTGVALVNPSSEAIALALTLRDATGRTVDRVPDFRLEPGRRVSVFEDELFAGPTSALTTGSMTFETQGAGAGVAAVTIRLGANARGEPLFATLPLVDLDLPPEPGPIVFPQVGAGGSLSTQIILINRGGDTLRGLIRLFGADGAPLRLEADGVETDAVSYEIEPEGVFRTLLTSSSGVFQGYAQVEAEEGPIPAGTAVFQFRDGSGGLVSEAGVAAAAPTRRARIFVDTVRTQTGLAIANAANPAQSVRLRLLDRQGVSLAATNREVPRNGHFASFAEEFFPNLPTGFTGVLEIEADAAVVPVTLKLTVNERGDLILTTLPVADSERPPSSSRLIVPQFANGQGLSTRLILINPGEGPAGGAVSLFDETGAPLELPFSGENSSRRDFLIPGRGGIQLRPGNSAAPVRIVLDPGGVDSSEIAVNSGASLTLRPLVIDSRDDFRDDFALSFTSLDESVAEVDPRGRIEGRQPGFATLAVSAAGALATVTVTVSDVSPGAAAFEVSGVSRDLAGRLYLTSRSRHAVFRSDGLEADPQLYAGTDGNSGFQNGERLQALFFEPAFLAINQAQGRLYVSDGENHAIRSVDFGLQGRVETLAGGNGPGARDGEAADSSFRRPEGLALDDRGGLWVADSANHTIRRVMLAAGRVETVAGAPGEPGFADGTGSSARFDSPVGIAIEVEPLARQLERSLSGEPPPPVSVIVADAGNGAVRRVFADGRVETLSSPGAGVGPAIAQLRAAVAAVDPPESVTVDASGAIYATFPQSGRVTVLLPDGRTASAAQAGTFSSPRTALVSGGGRLLVSDAGGPLREVAYGAPVIDDVTPGRAPVAGGVRVSVEGRNFAPETVAILSGIVVADVEVLDTRRIAFTAPPLPSGRLTLTLQNRGGLAQTDFLVEPPPLPSLNEGEITTVAGGSTFTGDGGPAVEAPFSFPQGLALDAAGNLYVGDTFNHRIRRVLESTGTVNSVAGNGMPGFEGDGGLAAASALNTPGDLALDPGGNLFFADSLNARIRRVDAATGEISTVAGNGNFSFSGDAGPAAEAALSLPKGLALDAAGNLFIADTGNSRIRRVDATSGIISTVAGDGRFQTPVDNVPATESSLFLPDDVAVDGEGNLFISDTQNHRVRRVDALTRMITTVAGTGTPGFGGDGGPAVDARLNSPAGIAIGLSGEILFADRSNQRIRGIVGGTIETLAGDGSLAASGDGGPALEAALANPVSIARDGAGNLLIADSGSGRVRRVDALSGLIDTVAGNGMANISGDGGPAFAGALASPFRVAFDSAGGLLIVETGTNRLRRVDPVDGNISTLAGTGAFGFSDDGGIAATTSLAVPEAVAEDAAGNLYVSERLGHRIRRIEISSGRISTYAGIGQQGFSPDGSSASEASFDSPSGIAFDADGNLLICDTQNHRVRRIVSASGLLETVAGNGAEDFSGDGGPAVSAALNRPTDLFFDSQGHLFVLDSGNRRIRRIDATTGVIETVAGGGAGDPAAGPQPIPALEAAFVPTGLAIDGDGTIYLSDNLGHRVWAVESQTGLLRLVAGDGTPGIEGDGGDALEARLSFPRGLALGPLGDLFIADTFNNRVRAVRSGAR